MSEELRQLLEAQLARRGKISPRLTCFGPQDAFLEDKSMMKAALCTRRAGKSYCGGIFLAEGALETPNSLSVYIGLTRDSARNIMWPVLEQLNRQFQWRAEMIESRLTMRLPNNSEIFLRGADQANFIERLRGPKYKRAVIDEGQGFSSHIEELIDGVLTPALLDLNGQLAILGTPGARPQGFFYDITNEDRGIPIYRWSLFQNPFIPNARKFVDDLMARRGWTEANPTYRREYLGEWVLDIDALVYKFEWERNTYSPIERKEAQDTFRILGVDFGYSPDPCAFTIVEFSRHDRTTYVSHAEKHPELTVSDIAEKIRSLMDRYRPIRIVADTGALGKMIAAELVKRFQLPIKSAEKTEKLMNQQLMNGEFIDGHLVINKNLKDLIHQLQTLTKDDDGEEDKRLPNDLCDALLYAWRESQAYASRPQVPKISRDSNEFMAQYEQLEAEKLLQRREQKANQAQGEDW